MKEDSNNLLEAMSCFLAGTFLLQVLTDPALGNLLERTRTGIMLAGYAFLAWGLVLTTLTLIRLLPYFSGNTRIMTIHNKASDYSLIALFLGTLSAVVATGLTVNPWITVIMVYLTCISYIWSTGRAARVPLGKTMKSLSGVGGLLFSLGASLMFIRLVAWLLEAHLPYEWQVLGAGAALSVFGCLLLLTSRLKARRTLKPSEQKVNGQTAEAKVSSQPILTDEPISSAQQDRLNRSQFAIYFGQTLVGYADNSCLIAALYGEWGSGKSSLLNLIEKELRSTSGQDCIVIRFNPWNISSLDQLVAAFFQELKVAVRGKRAGQFTGKTADLLNVFGGILSVGQLSPVGSQYFALGAEGASKLGTTIRKARDKSIDEIKQQLNDSLTKTAKRIFVLIDDIDRLDAQSARLLFRMIRLNADFSNTTYLLSFDPNVVERLLDGEQAGHGRAYLEKIVQLPVHIPTIDNAVLTDILKEELDNRVVKTNIEKFDDSLWRDLVLSGRFFAYFKTMRDVVRYVNGLTLNYPPRMNNVNMVDFMAVEAIRVFASSSYDSIRRNKALLVTGNALDGLLERPKDTAELKNLVSNVLNPERTFGCTPATEKGLQETVAATCRFLFPRVNAVYYGATYAIREEVGWREKKRICSSDMFDNYFLIGVPKGYVSGEEMLAILSLSGNSADLKKAIDAIFDKGLGKRFLNHAEDYLGRIPPEHIGETLLALSEIEDRVASEKREMLSFPADWQVTRLMYLLLERMGDKEKRKEAILSVMKRTSEVLPAVNLVLAITDSQRKGTSKKLGFSETDVQDLQAACADKIREQASSARLSKCRDLWVLMLKWHEWGRKEEVDAYTQSLLTSDEGVVDLVVGFSSEVLSSEEPRRRVEIRKKTMAQFVDMTLLDKKVVDLVNSRIDKLNQHQQESVQAYLRGDGVLDKME